jgi:hypothetical protein
MSNEASLSQNIKHVYMKLANLLDGPGPWSDPQQADQPVKRTSPLLGVRRDVDRVRWARHDRRKLGLRGRIDARE